MMTDAILALGLLFTTASQLRIANLPVGPGELALLLWIAAVSARHFMARGPLRSPAVFALLGFWGVFAVALSLGMLMAMAMREDFEPDLVLHDAVAYVLAAAFSCLAAAETPLRLRRVCWIFVFAGALSMLLQLANGFGLYQLDAVDPWYWERLRGWSDNPNQLSVICLVLTLLAWYLADSAANTGARIAALGLMIPPLVGGRLSGSDTFVVALTVAFLVWVVLKLAVYARNESGKSLLRGSFATITLAALPVLALSAAPLALTRAEELKNFMIGFAKNGGQEAAAEADLRMDLWKQAVTRGVSSAMLGLGPGPHLEIPPSIVAGRVSEEDQPENVAHPIQNGTANFEAHNTLLDVFTQGGMLAVGSLLWLLIRAIKCAFRAQAAALATLLTGVATFMMTGNIARQPIFWFAVVLCLTARNESPNKRVVVNSYA
jgi:O-Antigen ligase